MIHFARDIGPMNSEDWLNTYRARNESGTDIGASGVFRIVAIAESSSSNGRRREIKAADPATITGSTVLYVTKGYAIADGKSGMVRKSAQVIGVDTSGREHGDPVYLQAGGAWGFTGDIVVGFVDKVDATNGSVHLNPQGVTSVGGPGLGQTVRITRTMDISQIGTPGATYTLLTVPDGQKWSLTNLRLTTSEVLNGTGVTAGDIGISGDTTAICDASVTNYEASVGSYATTGLGTSSDLWDNTNHHATDYEVDASGGAEDIIMALGTTPTTGVITVSFDATRTV